MKQTKIIIMLLIATLCCCDTNEKEEEEKKLLPVVEIASISGVNHNSAIITGRVTFEGNPPYTNLYMYVNPNHEGISVEYFLPQGENFGRAGSYTAVFRGLLKNTSYTAVAAARNAEGTEYSYVLDFKTEDMDINKGLVAFYSFDEQNTNESQGKEQYNAINIDSEPVTYSTNTPGNTGYSASFNGNSYVKALRSPFVDIPLNSVNANMTISLWIKTMRTNTVLLSDFLGIDGGFVWVHGRTNRFTYSNGDFLCDDDWHLITISTYSDAHYIYWNLYLDGKFYASNVRAHALPRDFFIGRGFNGRMDNLRIYNRVLTQSEITELYETKQ